MILISPALAAGEGRVVINTQETTLSKTAGGASMDSRATLGAVLRWIGAKENGWYHVILRNGEDGWIPDWTAALAPADSPLPPAFGPTDLPSSTKPLYGVAVSDNITWRATPYGGLPAKLDTTRGGIIPRGAAIKLTDKIFHWFQAQIGEDDYVWVYDEALAPAPDAPEVNGFGLPEARLLSMIYNKTADGGAFDLEFTRPAPYLLKSNLSPAGADFKFFGVACEALAADWDSACGSTGARCACAPGSAQLVISAPSRGGAPAGFSGAFTGGTFRISIRDPILSPIKKIVIDPGHGSLEPEPLGYLAGTKTKTGVREKDVVLTISKKLADYLRADGYMVYLTREDDASALIDIYRRVDFSNQAGADLFVSVHANGDENPAMKGAEVYWYEPQSRPLAEMIEADISAATGRAPGGVFYASFGVTRQTRIPAVLVETGYMTNPEESAGFADSLFLEQCAEGIARGIARYAKSLSVGEQ
jgi:N-acetylmuramoyl-L-alanine amidase